MGAAPGFRHRPQIQECSFVDQVRAGVVIENFGAAIEDPRFHKNTFPGGFYGIDMGAWLPFTIAKTWHLQLAVFWIATWRSLRCRTGAPSTCSRVCWTTARTASMP